MIQDFDIPHLTLMAKRRTIPISVLIEVCYTCNQNCVHCCLADHTRKGLSLRQYESLFNQLVDAGTLFVILTGGEPFSRPDFMDIIRAARRRRLSVTVFTNGTLLTSAMIDGLKALHVHEVHVSLYSADPGIHDSITRRRNSFCESLNSIKALSEAGVAVRIKCPLTRQAAGGLREVKKLAKQLSVPVQFTNVITSRDDGDASTHCLRLGRESLLDVLTDREAFPWSKTPVHFRENLDCIPCDTVLNGGAVGPKGDVYPCNQWQVSGGNVLSTPFVDIWRNSAAFVQLRAIRLRDLEKCGTCELFEFCSRCPGLAGLEDKEPLGCSSAAREVAQVRKQLGIYPVQTNIFSKV